MADVDLSVEIAGITFKNPIILASGPPTRSAERIIRAMKYGAAGAVTKTITYDVMQQIQPRPRMYVVRPHDALAGRYYSFYSVDLMSEYKPERWISEIGKVKAEVKDGVLIASIAGRTYEEWSKLAQLVERAGADMVELNVSCPHIEEGELMGRAAVSDIDIVRHIIKTVKESTSLPVVVKLTPHGAHPVKLARVAVEAGADVLVSTARFQGLILDVNTMKPILWGGFGGYGGPWQVPISLSWTAHIAMQRLKVPLIGSGGISSWRDVLAFILVGAKATQMCTAIMMHGYQLIPKLLQGIEKWMKDKGFASLEEFRGRALESIIPLEKLSRKKAYIVKIDRGKCTGCGICVRVCPYDAIYLDDSRKAVVDHELCDNCGLCMSLCPTNAISLTVMQHDD